MGPMTPIPTLFPKDLQEQCLNKVLKQLITCGKIVERKACADLETTFHPRWHSRQYGLRSANPIDDIQASPVFMKAVRKVSNFLKDFVSSQMIDFLLDTAKHDRSTSQHAGMTFVFSVLCNERLTKLQVTTNKSDSQPMSSSLMLWMNTPPALQAFSQLSGLTYLTLHKICTDSILEIVSETCSRLQVLDVSHSDAITDLGLLQLCGNPRQLRAKFGCQYLRELRFNPCKQSIMPRVVAHLLKHLSFLEVVDMAILHQAIEYYYHGAAADVSYHPKPNRIAPLKLVHYTGCDRLADVIPICPKLRTFKIFVTESLPNLGATLQSSANALDQVTLVFGNGQTTLQGLDEFLRSCGARINALHVDCCQSATIKLENLRVIASECKFLDVLTIESPRLSADVNLESFLDHAEPLHLPFLSEIRLVNIQVHHFGKQFFRLLLAGCPDVERVHLTFGETAFYFSDFLLDDLLGLNPMLRLETFVIENVSLTLISALRLISSRYCIRGNVEHLKH